MEQQTSTNIFKNDNLLNWCLAASLIFHLLIVSVMQKQHVTESAPIFVTLPANQPILADAGDGGEVRKISPLPSQEISDEVKRMMHRKESNESHSTPVLVSELCKEQKEILGIGVKLTFGTDNVISAPEYLPAYQHGIREGDHIIKMHIDGTIAHVDYFSDTNNSVNIPVVNLCKNIRGDF